VPAPPSSPIDSATGHLAELAGDAADEQPGLPGLLARVADPRARRGVRHRLTGILGLALCAVVAGARSFTAIAEWVADADTQTLRVCWESLAGCPRNQHSGGPCGAWTRMPSMTWRAPGRSRPRCRGRSSGGSSRWMARPYAARLAAGPPVITCWPPSIMLTAPSRARWKFGAKTTRSRCSPSCSIA